MHDQITLKQTQKDQWKFKKLALIVNKACQRKVNTRKVKTNLELGSMDGTNFYTHAIDVRATASKFFGFTVTTVSQISRSTLSISQSSVFH